MMMLKLNCCKRRLRLAAATHAAETSASATAAQLALLRRLLPQLWCNVALAGLAAAEAAALLHGQLHCLLLHCCCHCLLLPLLLLLLLLHLLLLQLLMPMGSKLAENSNTHVLACQGWVPFAATTMPWAAISAMCVSHETYVSLDGVDVSCQ